MLLDVTRELLGAKLAGDQCTISRRSGGLGLRLEPSTR